MTGSEITVYKTLTDQVKNIINNIDIVFPARYHRLFSEVAKEHNVELGPDEIMTNEMLDDKVVEHAEHLSNSANKAVNAIETENKAELREVLEETKALREEIEQLKNTIYQDTLTKVFNRRWMEDNYLTDDGNHFKTNGVLVIIDMNDFKYINDNFGHISGDKVLYYVASQLKRTGGNVVRYGGDEFFVVFDEDMTQKEAAKKMHIIRELVIKKQLKVNDNRFQTSFSYGMTSFNSGDKADTIVETADENMYSDKIQIKNRLNT